MSIAGLELMIGAIWASIWILTLYKSLAELCFCFKISKRLCLAINPYFVISF